MVCGRGQLAIQAWAAALGVDVWTATATVSDQVVDGCTYAGIRITFVIFEGTKEELLAFINRLGTHTA